MEQTVKHAQSRGFAANLAEFHLGFTAILTDLAGLGFAKGRVLVSITGVNDNMKKTNMKQNLLILAVAAMAVTSLRAASTNSPNWGTDILHYSVREHFTGDSNASAVVDFQSKTQGKADHQKFNLTARGLAPNATYSLLSLQDDDTEPGEATQFTTDAKGNAKLRFKSNGNGNGNGNGKGNQSLPGELLPLTTLSNLTIVDLVTTQAVMTADLSSPDRLSYLVKRKLQGANGESALLMIKGTQAKTHFNLKAVNLSPTNDYSLAINETPVQTYQTDASGRLRINALTQPITSPLEIEKVQLLDVSSNVVFSTELP